MTWNLLELPIRQGTFHPTSDLEAVEMSAVTSTLHISSNHRADHIQVS